MDGYIGGDAAVRELLPNPHRGRHFIARRIGRIKLHIASDCRHGIFHYFLLIHLLVLTALVL
jgi:hypothetical protein